MIHKDLIWFKIFSQPAWDVSERSQSDPHWERHIGDLSETSLKRWLFCDVFKTSQIHLKKMPLLWRLQEVSKTSQKRCILRDIFKTSRAYFKKDVFSVTSLRHPKNISDKYFWFFKNTPQKWFRVISVVLLQSVYD